MGLDALIEAVARLRHELPDLLLLVGGSGSLRAELEALVARLHAGDHVRFLGFVPEAELPGYYQAADAFVLPTRELEGFGLVTVEAFACGTPVLGTPVGATPELIMAVDPGLVFRDPGPEAIADGVLRFLEWSQRDPAAAARLRLACRREATARYAWEGAVLGLEATLAEVAGRRVPLAPPVPACPACGEPMRAGDLYYAGRAYARCPGCGTGASATLPAADHLRRYYETEYPIRYRHQWVAEPRADMFGSLLDRLGRLAPPGRLLHIGCGGGHLGRAAADRGWRVAGTDVAHAACAVARRQHGLSVFQAESARLPVRDGCANATSLVNVLDHLLDPAAAIMEAYRVLAPGGHLVVRVPNARFHRPAVRAMAALGPLARWRSWDRYPILHLYAFTPAGLRRLAAQAGFRVLAIRNSSLAAQPGAGGRQSVRATALGGLRAAVAASTAAIALLSGGRVICGPSLELYATRPSRRSADEVTAR
jgi:SAM-dependent methyltransferase